MTAATDHDRMHRALEPSPPPPGRRCPRPTPGWAVVIEATDGACFEGATQPRGPPRRDRAPCGRRRRRTTCAAPPPGSPSSPAPTTAARRRAPTPSSTPASPASSSPSRTPTPRWRVGASRGCAAAGVDVEVGVGATEGRGAAGPLPPPPPHRPALRRAQAGGVARRPHRRARRVEPLDHRSGGPGRRPPAARRERRGPRRRRHRPGRRPGAHRPRRPAPRGDPLRVVLGQAPAGAKVHPCLELDGDVARRCSTSSAPRAILQVLVEGGATVAARVPPAGSGRPLRALPRAGPVRRRRRSTASSPAPAPPPSPTSGAAASLAVDPPRRRPPHRPATPGAAPDVHRHRRGAGHRACRATAPASGSAPAWSSTTSRWARRSP